MPIRIVRIGLAHDNHDFAARIAGTRDIPLTPVDYILITIAHNTRLDISRVTGCDRWLSHGKGRTNLALKQRFKPGLTMFFSSVARQHFHVAGIGRTAIEDFTGKTRAPHELAQRSVFKIGQAATVGVGTGFTGRR